MTRDYILWLVTQICGYMHERNSFMHVKSIFELPSVDSRGFLLIPDYFPGQVLYACQVSGL